MLELSNRSLVLELEHSKLELVLVHSMLELEHSKLELELVHSMLELAHSMLELVHSNRWQPSWPSTWQTVRLALVGSK